MNQKTFAPPLEIRSFIWHTGIDAALSHILNHLSPQQAHTYYFWSFAVVAALMVKLSYCSALLGLLFFVNAASFTRPRLSRSYTNITISNTTLGASVTGQPLPPKLTIYETHFSPNFNFHANPMFNASGNWTSVSCQSEPLIEPNASGNEIWIQSGTSGQHVSMFVAWIELIRISY